jgi:hypothetical protein
VRVRAVIDDSHDDDDDMETDTYYGQIEEIWELDYVGLKVALFWCRWVTNGKRAMSKDKYGYVSVDLRVFGYKNELFVFANDVEQVFYVPDLAKKNWYVVMPEKRTAWIENVVEEEEYNQFDEIPSFDTSYKPQLLGTNKTLYLRCDHSEKIYIRNQEKASLIFAESFFNKGGWVYWWKWNLFCNIKDEMYWWNFNPFCNIWDVM